MLYASVRLASIRILLSNDAVWFDILVLMQQRFTQKSQNPG